MAAVQESFVVGLVDPEFSKQSRKSSLLTASTAEESQDSLPVVESRKKSLKKTSSKKSSKRRTSASRTAAGRDMLMGMIAQEMMSSWNGEGEVVSDVSPAAPKSMADIFYAQMNGEAIDASTHSSYGDSKQGESDIEEEYEDDEDCAPDHCSFAGFDMVGVKDDNNSFSNASGEGKRGRRSSDLSKNSLIGSTTSISQRSKGSKGSSEGSQSQESEAELSIDEIQQYVMEHIPQSLRDQISKDDWNRIFGDAIQADKTRKISQSPSSSVVLDLDNLPQEEDKEEVDDDDLSVISDITEATSFRKGSRPKAVAPKAPEEDWELDIDPALAPDVENGSVRSYRTNCSRPKSTASINTDARSRASVKSRASTGQATNPSRLVSFHVVQVRYYERILDLNPAVTSGPPLGIGWRFKKGGQTTVDDWEIQRGQHRKPNDLVIPRHVRESILREIGYKPEEIAEATRLVLKAKNQRRQTVSNLSAAPMEEAVEKAARRVKGLLSFGRTKGLIKK